MRDDVVHQMRCPPQHLAPATSCAPPAPLAVERLQLVLTAFAAVQPQKAVRHDAALEEGVELVPNESRQLPAPLLASVSLEESATY